MYEANRCSELFPTAYQLPAALRPRIAGKRVAIVNDVINAGSAVRGTYADLETCGADSVVMGTLLTLGVSPKSLANHWSIDLVTIAAQPNLIWPPGECPMCAKATPLDNA